MPAMLEHANITVTDAEATAEWMTSLFGWHIRWDGEAKDGGRSIHIGTDAQYVALYQPSRPVKDGDSTYTTKGGLNHLAVVVDDIDAMERQVIDAGFKPVSHADYEPGKRFYFHDHDDIEFEIVDYS